jgi:hypothetical protein
MKTYGGVEVQLHHFWPRHQMEVSGQLHRFTPGIHWIANWVDPEPVWTLRNLLPLPVIEPRPPARSYTEL